MLYVIYAEILHFVQPTVGHRGTHSANILEETLTLTVAPWSLIGSAHSLSSLYVRKSSINLQKCEPGRGGNGECSTPMFLFGSLLFLSSFPLHASGVRYFARGKLPHTTSSFNPGPKKMILLVLKTFKPKLSSRSELKNGKLDLSKGD